MSLEFNREFLKQFRVSESEISFIIERHGEVMALKLARLIAESIAERAAVLPPEAGALLRDAMKAINPEQAARIARCDRKTIDRAIAAGQIRATKGSTGLVFVDRPSLVEWAKARNPALSEIPKVVQ